VVPSSTPGTSPGNTPGTEPQPTSGGGNSVRAMVDEATRAIGAGDLVKGRALLNRALADRASTAQERAALRQQIAALNDTLFFSPTVAKGDPIADTYAIAAGDYLTTIVSKQGLPVEWQLIARINKVNPNALKVGQKIKVIRQPLHAVVSKSGYRMDIYAGDPSPAGGSMGRELGPDGQDTSWTYIRSFNVGLGESNGTPEGSFVIRPRSKMTNPSWVNPRDPKQRFSADDPKNPIGEHWLGLEGTDDVTRKFTGYGIHGTIDPASIGKQMSMGCVRLLGPDIEMVYEMLRDRISTVRIVR
jgi:lipoprotein-anchoring transpeptidase ErfK/SrfK